MNKKILTKLILAGKPPKSNHNNNTPKASHFHKFNKQILSLLDQYTLKIHTIPQFCKKNPLNHLNNLNLIWNFIVWHNWMPLLHNKLGKNTLSRSVTMETNDFCGMGYWISKLSTYVSCGSLSLLKWFTPVPYLSSKLSILSFQIYSIIHFITKSSHFEILFTEYNGN